MEYASWTVLVAVVLAVGLAGLLSGCAHLIPKGPACNEERFLGPAESPQPNDAEPRVDHPVLPFAVWGLYFDEEIVLELTDHPTWRMLEVCLVRIRDEEFAFSLDSHRCGRQWVAVDDRSEAVAGGFPAPTYRSDLDVERSEDERHIRYAATWTMQTGERIEVQATVRKPLWSPLQRNGNTMNHSQETALAAIDLERLRPARASVTIDGEPARISPLSRMMLVQAAAGLMSDRLGLRAAGEGLEVDNAAGDTTAYRRLGHGGGFDLIADRPTATETWRFAEIDGGQHLQQVTLRQEGRDVLRLRFNPALPDLRRPVTTAVTSRMVMAINGRPGTVAGEVRVSAGEGDTTVIDVLPSAPSWAAARPVRSVISLGDEVVVDSEVTTPEPWSFGDVACPE
jgi:hypothetical protein